MRKLLNYSIETDHLIWLEFNDGHNLRVAPGEVSDHLTGADLARVKRALKLRRDFIRQNFPKTLILALAVGLSAFAVADSREISQYLTGSHALPAAPSPAANPAVILSTPTPAAASPLPDPASAPVRTPATAVPAVPAVSHPQLPSQLQGAPLPTVETVPRPLSNVGEKLTKLVDTLGL